MGTTEDYELKLQCVSELAKTFYLGLMLGSQNHDRIEEMTPEFAWEAMHKGTFDKYQTVFTKEDVRWAINSWNLTGE